MGGVYFFVLFWYWEDTRWDHGYDPYGLDAIMTRPKKIERVYFFYSSRG
jgi:hypothetical protein